MANPPAWHPDPMGRHEHRYWDGERWTDHVADGGQASLDPLDSGGPATETQDAGAGAPPGSAQDMPAAEPGTGAEPTQRSSAHDTAPMEPGAWSPSSSPAPGAGSYPQSSGNVGFPAATGSAAGSASSGGNPAAIGALVLGIVTLLACWSPLLGAIAGRAAVAVIGLIVVVAAIAAIVLGIRGRRVALRTGSGSGMAVTGIVTGSLAVAGGLLFLAIALFVSGFTSEFSSLIECVEETGDEDFCTEEFERNLFDRLDN